MLPEGLQTRAEFVETNGHPHQLPGLAARQYQGTAPIAPSHEMLFSWPEAFTVIDFTDHVHDSIRIASHDAFK